MLQITHQDHLRVVFFLIEPLKNYTKHHTSKHNKKVLFRTRFNGTYCQYKNNKHHVKQRTYKLIKQCKNMSNKTEKSDLNWENKDTHPVTLRLVGWFKSSIITSRTLFTFCQWLKKENQNKCVCVWSWSDWISFDSSTYSWQRDTEVPKQPNLNSGLKPNAG